MAHKGHVNSTTFERLAKGNGVFAVNVMADGQLSKIAPSDIERYKKQVLSEPTLLGGDRESDWAKGGARTASRKIKRCPLAASDA